jgi:hypothetical protein
MATIRYGSQVVLQHNATQKILYSPGVPYVHNGASGQDQVKCKNQIDAKSIWIVKPPDKYPDNYLYGLPVQAGAIVRLENRATGKNLHSHANIPSPLSGQGEVTCAGLNGECDINDNWWLELDSKVFETDRTFKLIHTATRYALHSHGDRTDALGQEVTGYSGRDPNDNWKVITIFGPIVSPLLSSTGKASSWLAVLNLAASVASISGVTFLVLGASLKTTSFAQLLSVIIMALLVFGSIWTLILLLFEVHRQLKLRMRSAGWLVALWTTGSGVGLIIILYLLQFISVFRSAAIEPLLQEIFGAK